MTIAVYPGSFDPPTNGHLDVANRAASLFDELVIAIYETPPKQLLFTAEERVELMRKAVSHLPNARVVSYAGLTVDFARKLGAKVLVRGLRMTADFEREFEMALMNKKLVPELESIYLMASLEYEFLSSSLLKEVAQLRGDIYNLVPEHVAAALRKKFDL